MTDGNDEEQLKELLAQVEASSKGCSTVAVVMIAACLFSLLTCGTFKDAELITKASVTASIPGVGLSLPVQRFIQAAPWLLLTIQLYFLIVLHDYQKLVEEVSGRSRNRNPKFHSRAYLSIFNRLSNAFDTDRAAIRRLGYTLAVSVAYLLVPFSILMIWFRSLALHGHHANLSHIPPPPWFTVTALFLSVLLSIWEFTARTNENKKRVPRKDAGLFSNAIAGAAWGSPLAILAFGILLYGGQSFWSACSQLLVKLAYLLLVAGILEWFANTTSDQSSLMKDWNWWVKSVSLAEAPMQRRLWLLVDAAASLAVGVLITSQAVTGKVPESKIWIDEAVVYFQTARVGTAELSKKPAGWDGSNLKVVAGPLLQNENLRYMFAFQVFAVHSHLEKADLTGADLAQADLREASLNSSKLDDVHGCDADFSGADLTHASLLGADLRYANLQGANLSTADVLDTDFRQADLRCSNLKGTKLSSKQLEDAELVNDGTLVDPPLIPIRNRIISQLMSRNLPAVVCDGGPAVNNDGFDVLKGKFPARLAEMRDCR